MRPPIAARHALVARRPARRALSSTPPPPAHSDIESFQRYAAHVALAPTTTVYVGTLYEYISSHCSRSRLSA